MIIEISDIFLDQKDSKNILEIQLDKPKKIIDILEEIGVKNLGYANFYLNDRKVNKNNIAKNQDKLTVLPIVGGG